MITARPPTRHTTAEFRSPASGTPAAGWQEELAAGYSHPAELLAALGLDAALLAPALAAHGRFRVRVPRGYAARMRHGDPADPLLRQVLPAGEELTESPGFSADPLGESGFERVPGLLQKYRGRALLITTGACAVHCRYCFRREFPYSGHVGGARLAAAIAALAADTGIEEVILSGGDPLTLTDPRLAGITAALERIPHIRRLRVHTRLPLVLPARVDAGLLGWIARLPWPVVFVLHANHAAELGPEVAQALAWLREAGVHLLNQSVLLRGVNDDADALASLSLRLFEAGVLPYYVHLLDRVRGAAHFDVPEEEARNIVRALATRLPGYLVPRLVREVAGEPFKVAVALGM